MFRTISLRVLTLSTFLFTVSVSAASAQQRFSAGPRLGLNLSNYWGNSDGMSMKPGLAAGVGLMYSSLNHFGLGVDVLYSQRGARYRGNNLEFTQRVNYLEIPVVAKYFLTLNGNFRPNVYIGPSLGVRLNAKRVNGEYLQGSGPVINGDNNNDFNSLDLGATGGFQLNWRGAGERQRFLIDARYTLGLSEVQAGLPNLWGRRNSLQNSTITLTLGYSFGVGPEYRSRYRR
ncbi:hypothetical protein AWR27_11845 [Spirosoma montaniterrae]|uniref:Outer membrane protein beta-barrel domain-containing protein n=1 Tax=Spirosoma montaniterrae TaxID=1178516 RepID=A0A1P9WX44_9BACT|nr:hypothetical protein AWR27_11845 [Spirosoma montaniterrae]